MLGQNHNEELKGRSGSIDEFSNEKELAKKIAEGEEAITSKDIDVEVEKVFDKVVNVQSELLLGNQKVIKDLVQEELLKMFQKSVQGSLGERAWGSLKNFLTGRKTKSKEKIEDILKDKDYRYGLERIQDVFLERLQSKLTNDSDVIIPLDKLQMGFRFASTEKPHVVFTKNLKKEEKVYRVPHRFRNIEKDGNSPEGEIYDEALKEFLSLPKNEHIIGYEHYDTKKHSNISEKVKLDTANDILFDENNKLKDKIGVDDVVETMSALNDCIDGANFLVRNDLVLQDISPHNIGIVKDESGKKRGALFDLEGLYKKDAPRHGRMVNTSIFGGSEKKSAYVPPELDDTKPTPVQEAEMVFQFGSSLESILYAFNQIVDRTPALKDNFNMKKFSFNVRAIKDKMTSFDASNKENPTARRISLEIAHAELKEQLEQLQKNLSSVV